MTEKDIRIFNRIKSDFEYATSLGYKVLGVFLQGSQNYNLDYEGSDIDTKAIVVPSFDDFVLNKKPVSTTLVLEDNSHLDIKDIRLMHECFRKQNINFIEILFTKYKHLNPQYAALYQPMFDNNEKIAHYNNYAAVNCIAGMVYEKHKAMEHPYDGYLELRGECVVSWENFHKINEGLAEPYSHPRNLAAGSLRNLDTNITKRRHLSYIVFECVSDLYDLDGSLFDSKWNELGYLDILGFTTVERRHGAADDCVDDMPPDAYEFPVDGLIFEMCMKSYSKSLASTGHHEGCRMALKWADSTYETVLRDVVWDVGRSGVISPVAVFDEVDLDGALTTKATLHNLSIIDNLELGIGDTITVYRSNMVIPKIDDNLTRSNTLAIPSTCPCCGHPAEIKYTDNSKFLMCVNPNCSAKLLAQFTHFVSRNCANIDGLSEKTLNTFISHGFLRSFKDIYHLWEHYGELTELDGFGTKSIRTLLDSISKSRKIKLEGFIAALGIPNVGLSAAKIISKHFNGSEEDFMIAYENGFDWTTLDDFGAVMAKSLNEYLEANYDDVIELTGEFEFVVDEKAAVDENPFNGKSVAVTGKLIHFTRDSINAKLESLGAKPASGVTAKTDYLINNDPTSNSSKNKKANELNIPIITEDEFLLMIGDAT